MRAYLLSEQRNVRKGSRAAILYNRRMLLIIAVIFCLFSFVFVFSTISNANKTVERHYISVEINEGDTLWSICRDNYSSNNDNFDKYLAEVKSLNNLSSDEIHAGSYIVIPCYDKID